MSVTVNIYYTGEHGNARKFAEEMTAGGTVRQIRAEAGNERYEYFFPMEDPETVLLIDSWTDQQAIDAHHASPMMAEIVRLRDKYRLRMKWSVMSPTRQASRQGTKSSSGHRELIKIVAYSCPPVGNFCRFDLHPGKNRA